MRTLRILGMTISFTYTIESEGGKHFEGVMGIQSIQANLLPQSLSEDMAKQIVEKIQNTYKEEFKVDLGMRKKSNG